MSSATSGKKSFRRNARRDYVEAESLLLSLLKSGGKPDRALLQMAEVMRKLNRPREAIRSIMSYRYLCSDESQKRIDHVLLSLCKVDSESILSEPAVSEPFKILTNLIFSVPSFLVFQELNSALESCPYLKELHLTFGVVHNFSADWFLNLQVDKLEVVEMRGYLNEVKSFSVSFSTPHLMIVHIIFNNEQLNVRVEWEQKLQLVHKFIFPKPVEVFACLDDSASQVVEPICKGPVSTPFIMVSKLKFFVSNMVLFHGMNNALESCEHLKELRLDFGVISDIPVDWLLSLSNKKLEVLEMSGFLKINKRLCLFFRTQKLSVVHINFLTEDLSIAIEWQQLLGLQHKYIFPIPVSEKFC